MFTQTWNKYMPVIRILIKRSAGSEQQLNMNSTDFMRATGGRKIKFNFTMELRNGQLVDSSKQAPIVKEFALLLQEDEHARKLIRDQQLSFSLNNSFQLTIRNNTPVTIQDTASSEKTDGSADDAQEETGADA